MIRVRLGLVCLLALELCGVWLAVLNQPSRVPPRVDASFQHPATTEEIQRLWQEARDGGHEQWQRLAECYAVYGYFPEALATIEFGRLDAPRSYRWLFWKGLILNRLGFAADSNQAFSWAQDEATKSQRQVLWHLIGRNELRMLNPDRAEDAFKEAGDLLVARYERVRLMVRLGRPGEAISILDALLRESPESFQLHHWRARAAEAQGDLATARRHDELVERTEQQLPTDLVVETLMAEADRFGFWGRLAGARKMLERGDHPRAISRLTLLVKAEWHPAAARMLANALLQNGSYRRAHEVLKQLPGRAAMGPLDWLMTGDVLEGLGPEHAEAAMAAWQKSLRLRSTEAARQRIERADPRQR